MQSVDAATLRASQEHVGLADDHLMSLFPLMLAPIAARIPVRKSLALEGRVRRRLVAVTRCHHMRTVPPPFGRRRQLPHAIFPAPPIAPEHRPTRIKQFLPAARTPIRADTSAQD